MPPIGWRRWLYQGGIAPALTQTNCTSPTKALTPPSHAAEHRASEPGSVGFRLRLADLAPGLRLPRTRARAADRRAPRAVRVLACPSRDAGATGAGARARLRRRLPWRRLPRRRQEPRRDDRLFARARAG